MNNTFVIKETGAVISNATAYFCECICDSQGEQRVYRAEVHACKGKDRSAQFAVVAMPLQGDRFEDHVEVFEPVPAMKLDRAISRAHELCLLKQSEGFVFSDSGFTAGFMSLDPQSIWPAGTDFPFPTAPLNKSCTVSGFAGRYGAAKWK